MTHVVDIASVVLLDRTGRVLMQLRDHDAPVDPGVWALPGGHVEPGEDVETGAHRELLEETGLTAELTLVGVVQRAGRDGETVRFHVFTGTTDASQGDVVCGEGEAMVFLPRDELTTRPTSRAAREVLALVLKL